MKNLVYCCAVGAALTCYASLSSAAQGQTSDADWAKINSLTWQATGLTTRFPLLQDSMLADTGGWRSDLAKHNIGIEPRIVLNGITDFNQNNDKPKDSYVGQGGDLMAATYFVDIVYGLDDLGLPNSKLIGCVVSTVSSVAANPPQ